MYKNKCVIEGASRNNIAGVNIARLRIERNWSQNDLAIELQNIGHDVHKNAIQQMESGERFITDIELLALAKVFNTDVQSLLKFSGNITFDKSDSHIK